MNRTADSNRFRAEHMLPGVTVKRDGDRLWSREELYPDIGDADDE